MHPAVMSNIVSSHFCKVDKYALIFINVKQKYVTFIFTGYVIAGKCHLFVRR